MSWIERPANQIVGEFDLSKLGIDEAYLNLSSSATQKLWLYKLSSNCFECPFRIATEIVQNPTELKISTIFPSSYRLRTSGEPELVYSYNDSSVFCDFKHNFGEFGVYNVHASDANNVNKCDVTVAAEPVSIYYPILIVVLFYFLLFALINTISLYLRKRRSSSPTHAPDSPPSTLSSSTNVQSNDCQVETNPIKSNGTGNGSSPSPSRQNVVTPNQSQASRVNPSAPPRQKQRLRSLDTFRGICIVVMIFVNDGGGNYYFFEHATWDGLYVADLVFPWFLWIMGVCIPIAIKSQVKRGTSRLDIFSSITVRSLKLIGLGILLSSRFGVQFGENANLRIPGVLQRFGVCYFVCASLVLFSMTINITKPGKNKLKAMIQDIGIIWMSWVVVLLILLVHCLLTFVMKVPGCPTGYLGPAGENTFVKKECIGGASGYLDRQIFTKKHLYQWPTAIEVYYSDVYDPEGFLGTLTSIFQVWIGVQAGATMLVFPRAESRVIRWSIWAVITGVLGTILCGGQQTGWWIPLNKNLWSLSFVLVTSSFALILLVALYIIIDMKNYWSGSPFYEPGMNSILLYVGHSVFYAALPWHWSVGLMSTHFIKLCEALWGTSLWVLIAIWLHNKKSYWSV